MGAAEFKAARDFLLANRTDYDAACRGFRWPAPAHFNWALDWFDAELAQGDSAARPALTIVGDGATSLTFAELSERSNRLANALRARGVKRGDRVLVMLGNVAPLWETMLAVMKLGAVVIPAATLLTPADLADRFARGRARHVVAAAGDTAKFESFKQELTRIAVGDAPAGWERYDDLLTSSAGVHAGRGDRRRRSDAALFHVRHHGEAQARAAFASLLSDRPSRDHVRARPDARRRASQRRLAGMGEARLELVLLAVERRRDGVRLQPAALRRQGAARRHRIEQASPRCARRRRCGAC